MDKSILIGDIVQIVYRSALKEYVWDKTLCRVDDIVNDNIVLKREGISGSYNICVKTNDIICRDVTLIVHRGKDKWKLEYSQ